MGCCIAINDPIYNEIVKPDWYNPVMQGLYRVILVCVFILQPVMVSPVYRAAATPVGFSVRFHPDGGIFVGDLVSLEVFAPPGFTGQNVKVQVSLLTPNERSLGELKLSPNAIGGQSASLLWAWDTSQFKAGDYDLKFVLTPGDQTWQETVHLLAPPSGYPPIWLERDTACCRLHYFSGSAAARDINLLAEMIDNRARLNAGILGFDLTKAINSPQGDKIDIDLIPRVLGQGGFTSDEIIVTYSDQNYIASDFGLILQHELVHRLDGLMGGDYRPLIFMEGLAVTTSSGHYMIEPILLLAANLKKDGYYIPLPLLANDFYSHQHEAGYIEAAALVNYLIANWGVDGFNQFYRDIHAIKGGTDAQAIDVGMKKHFGLSLQQMDDRLLAWLEGQPVLPDMEQDLRVTIDYFDLLRAYQAKFDPSADFRQTWLPDPREMRKRGIVADYLRGPNAAVDQTIEQLLLDAGQDWRAGQYSQAWINLGLARQAIQSSP
jgi:hypothetical protein